MQPALRFAPPRAALTPEETAAGLRWWTRHGIGVQAMDTLAAGAFVTAFALELGASNVQIGVLASLPFITQLAQLGGVYLNERWRNRRAIAIVFTGLSRPMYLGMAACALIPSPDLALGVLTAAIALRYLATAFMSPSWNTWIRDLVPEGRRGHLSGRRLSLMTGTGIVLGIVAAVLVDWWKANEPGQVTQIYAALFTVAFIGGAYTVWCTLHMPEPRQASAASEAALLRRLFHPYRDENYRRLLAFVASWSFAVNLAAPFFMVHMLKRLELDLWVVMSLTLLSQLAHMTALTRWGAIADRMSNKSVLQVCAPVFIGCVFAWTFTTFPDPHVLTIPLLVVIHGLTGIATAGVNLATANIAMKLAPAGDASVYLASNSLAASVASGIAPVLGGLMAHFFIARELSLTLRWTAPSGELAFDTISISQWDFYFALAAIIGLFAIWRLTRVREAGTVEEQVVMNEVLLEVRRFVQNLSSIAGLRQGTELQVVPPADGAKPTPTKPADT